MDYALLLRNFLDGDGRLKQMPAKHKMRAYVYLWAASLLEPGRRYSEGELNACIGGLLAYRDPATIRRALVDYGFMARLPDGSAYWLLDPQPTLADLGLAEPGNASSI